jgi:hypothetical protein
MPDFIAEGYIKNLVNLNGYLSDFGDFFDKNLTKMDDDCQNVDYKASQNKDSGSRSRRSRVLTRRHTQVCRGFKTRHQRRGLSASGGLGQKIILR